jgi:type I restriction enzyme S subunit
VFASYLVRLRAKPTYDPRFLAYYLESEAFWSFIRGVLGDKSAQPNASASTMTEAPLRAPQDKKEQRAIAHILGTLDDKIELNRRISETLEAMARAIFKSWFVDFEPVRAKAQGRETGLPKDIEKLFPDRFADSVIGEVPEGWCSHRLGDVAQLLRETVNPMATPTACFLHHSIPAFDDGRQPTPQLGAAIRSQKFRVPPDAVLLSKLNPEIERVWLVDVNDRDRAISSTEFLVLIARRPFTRSFLYCLVLSAPFRQNLESLVTGTSKSHQRAPVSAVMDISVAAPPSRIVEVFDALASDLLQRALASRAECAELAALRGALVSPLVSGARRVL